MSVLRVPNLSSQIINLLTAISKFPDYIQVRYEPERAEPILQIMNTGQTITGINEISKVLLDFPQQARTRYLKISYPIDDKAFPLALEPYKKALVGLGIYPHILCVSEKIYTMTDGHIVYHGAEPIITELMRITSV